MKKLGRIAILRAELVVRTAPETDTNESQYKALERLRLFRNYGDTSVVILREYSSSTGYNSVEYKDGLYRFDIAYHIKSLINGDIENHGLFLIPASGNENFTRSIITTGKHSNRMKLEIACRILD